MAEIILEPTALSKVIPLSLKLNDVDTSLNGQLITNQQFNTADTDAWFSFTLDGLAATTGTFDLTLINLKDKSVFKHKDKVFNTNPFYYKLDSGADEQTNEIRHAGKWVGQLVVTLPNGDSATRKFIFSIEGHILDGTVVQTILLEDYNALIADIESAKDELTQYNIDYGVLIANVESAEALRVQADLDREVAVDALIASETIELKVAEKYQLIESESADRLLSVEQQLEQTLNKSAITLSHMFADNAARDAYFVANPSELMEQLFIKVGSGYQQYLEGAWQASAAIVTEQLSATNQPIIDTGNYFATDNTNAALQELGAHKASTANPHGVTKAQVGLGNVDNTSDANKPVSTATQTALNLKADKTVTDGLNTRLTAEETATANNKVSTVKGKTFADVDARFEELETINSVVFDSTFNASFINGTWTADTGANTLNCSVAHGLIVGDSVSFAVNTGTLPENIIAEPEFYYVSAVPSTTAIQVSLTRNGVAVTIASAGETGWGIRKASVVMPVMPLDFTKYREVDIYSNLEFVPRALDGNSYVRVGFLTAGLKILLNDTSVNGQSDDALLYSLTMTKKYVKIPLRINIIKIGSAMYKISIDIRGLQSGNSDMSTSTVVNRDFGGIITGAEVTKILFVEAYTGSVKNGTRIVVIRR